MEKPKIGIVGFGIVGKSVAHAFLPDAEIKFNDKNIRSDSIEDVVDGSEFIFVSVPTPMLDPDGGPIDTTIIDSVIGEISKYASGTDKIIIVKSSVVPGTMENYAMKYPKCRFVYNPEFLTERTFLTDAIIPSQIILGGKKENTARLAEIYARRFPGVPIRETDLTTAQFVKYFTNCFFFVKVMFMNEMRQICQKLGIDYNEAKNIFLGDGRIARSHCDVPGHDGDLGSGGKCFPKDVNALIYKAKELGLNPRIMQAAWEFNLEIRKKRNW